MFRLSSNKSNFAGSSYPYLLETRRVPLISFSLDVKLSDLSKKIADTLVADNPVGFILDELTGLLERTFTLSVSFTDSTTDSDSITFQVNAVVGEVNDGGAVIPGIPTAFHTSSTMFSGSAGTSLNNTGNTLSVTSLPAAPEASLASSTTPTKAALDGSATANTPQSKRNKTPDQVMHSLLLLQLHLAFHVRYFLAPITRKLKLHPYTYLD
jgi:hypothetical protein